MAPPGSSDAEAAERELRTLAGKLVAATDSIRPYRLYDFAQQWLGAPSLADVSQASEHLIAIANGLHSPGAGPRNYERANAALACLRLRARVSGVIPKSRRGA